MSFQRVTPEYKISPKFKPLPQPPRLGPKGMSLGIICPNGCGGWSLDTDGIQCPQCKAVAHPGNGADPERVAAFEIARTETPRAVPCECCGARRRCRAYCFCRATCAYCEGAHEVRMVGARGERGEVVCSHCVPKDLYECLGSESWPAGTSAEGHIKDFIAKLLECVPAETRSAILRPEAVKLAQKILGKT